MRKHTGIRPWLPLILICALLCPCVPSLASSADQVSVQAAPLVSQSSAVNGMVRVYLSSLGSINQIDVTVKGTYSLSVTGEYLSDGASVRAAMDRSTGAISLTYNGQTFNMGQTVTLRRHSSEGGSGVYISQARESRNLYPGDLSLHTVKGGSGYTLYVIAHIYIENYLYGVLPYEMGNSTSIEALKAQAVAARTYTVRMMQSRASGLYDVKDTTSDQVYRGTPSGNANCTAAVDATKGIVLMYGSSYITTYYSASNGGQTDISRTGGNYPYMQVKDDPFDYANPSSTVKRKTIQADLSSTANPSGLISLLKSKAASQLSGYTGVTLQTLRSVTPHTPKYASPSRLYTKIDFTMEVSAQNAYGQTESRTITVTCGIFTELESLLSMSIQSSQNELWTAVEKSGAFVLEARRYGHGMGMSQRGAMQMAKLGYTYDQILGFYYDGCKRVKHSFTNTILSADSDEKLTTIEQPADSEEDGDGCRASVSLSSSRAVLAIRSGKSETAGLIGTAGNGALVQVLSHDGSWCQIRFGDLVGYVPAASLTISGTPPQSESPVSAIAGFVTVTANDFVNLRADASMSAKVVGTAPSGAVLTVFSVSGSWARVQYNALSGYANTGFLSSVSPSYPSGNLSDGGKTAYVRLSADMQPLYLRASASTDGQILAQLSDGAEVTVLSDDGSWSYVAYQGQTGYLLSSCLTDNRQQQPAQTAQPSPTPAAPSQTSMLAIVTTQSGSLNLRSLPQAGSSILTTIPRTAQVELTELGDTWCSVRYNGYTGYAMTRYLTLLSQDDSSPSPTPAASHTPGVSTAMVTTPSGTLNLRAEPRSGSAILTRIQPGETLTVYERGDEWCRVRYLDTDGYVMTVFLSFQESASTPAPSEGPAASLSPETSPSPTPQPTAGPDAVTAVVSTASGTLNLRAQPIAGSQVLAQLPRGVTVTVQEKLETWSCVTYNGLTGYVMNRYLRFSQSEPVSAGQTATVNTPSGTLNLRAEPYAAAQLLCQIPPYETVALVQYGDSWSCVTYNGITGYVMTRYLSVSAQPTQQPEASPTPMPTAASVKTAYVNTGSGALNLRQSPSSNAKVLTAIPKGAAIYGTDYDNTWFQTTYNGFTGYVMNRYLTYASAPASTPAPSPTASPSGDTDSGEPDASQAIDVWVDTSGGALNLRQTPDTSGQVLDTISKGVQVKLLEEGNTWSLIQYNGKRGYVMTRYLSVEPVSQTQAPQQGGWEDGLDPTLRTIPGFATAVIISPQAVKLWPMCRQEGSPLGSLSPGDTVQVLMLGETWSCVQTQTMQGYCLTECLQMVEE